MQRPITETDPTASAPAVPNDRLRGWTTAVLLVGGPLVLAFLYARYAFYGLSHPEAMDFAQLGRNLVLGQGFTTNVLRPLALDGASPLRMPDTTNGPLYPFFLALAFGALGARDGVAAAMSGLFYVATIPVLYLLGSRLFHRGVGAVSALIFALSAPALLYAVSARHVTLYTFLMTGLFLVVFQVLARWRDSAAPGDAAPGGALALAGILTGLLYLTDPDFFWLIPVVAGVLVWHGPNRSATAFRFGLPLGIVVLPWMLRNFLTSGHPFLGLQSYELWMDTRFYPGFTGYRVLQKNIVTGSGIFMAVLGKAFGNTGRVFQGLPETGPTWALAFFLPSLFFHFRDPASGVLRKLVLYSFLALLFASAVFVVEMELFFSIVPVVLVFAVAYLLHLMQQARFSARSQWWVTGLLALTALLPAFGSLNEKERYFFIYQAAIAERLTDLAQEGQVVLSDKPWMVAWYGQQPSLWIPAEERRIPEIRNRVPAMNWIFLTREVREESYPWQTVFDTFQQWNSQAAHARISRQPPPAPLRLEGTVVPLFGALQGFTTVDVGAGYAPPAVIGHVTPAPSRTRAP
ncbi:MAG: glycosyltransferase family 39 protein [Armatimonadetes bacterium]|nr:glycosyltransferase family 39 protein [Armatimonadota bacterium]